jgi:hypothetical protein
MADDGILADGRTVWRARSDAMQAAATPDHPDVRGGTSTFIKRASGPDDLCAWIDRARTATAERFVVVLLDDTAAAAAELFEQEMRARVAPKPATLAVGEKPGTSASCRMGSNGTLRGAAVISTGRCSRQITRSSKASCSRKV